MIWYILLMWMSFGFGQACIPRDYGFGSVVCVCNISYCDQLGTLKSPPPGIARLYESSKDGARFSPKDIHFTQTHSIDQWSEVQITIDNTKRFQKILGFGGAFSDAAGINILSLPSSLQDQIIISYYSSEGLDYNIGRVPIASTDFSTHVYSYDDVPGDFNLTFFNLTKEDLELKIPIIQRAKSLTSQPIKLFASPWSAPGWMKTNGDMSDCGFLKGDPGGQYYQTWAKYFVRFLKSYEDLNVTFWGLTIQNEPMAGLLPFYIFQAMGFTPEYEKIFIKNNLVPELQSNHLNRLKIMIMDDQRVLLPWWAYSVLDDKQTAEYVAGIGFHWYLNTIAPIWLLDIVNNAYPEKFLLATEACEGFEWYDTQKVKLGSWNRAESYAYDIIQDLLHWTTGWVDWNLVLDLNGGPNWAKNYVDAPIIVNSTSKEFYRQPMYYALAHFSKLLPPGSTRIYVSATGIMGMLIEIIAFERPDNQIVLIILNRWFFTVYYSVFEVNVGYITNSIPPHSFQSYIWNTENH